MCVCVGGGGLQIYLALCIWQPNIYCLFQLPHSPTVSCQLSWLHPYLLIWSTLPDCFVFLPPLWLLKPDFKRIDGFLLLYFSTFAWDVIIFWNSMKSPPEYMGMIQSVCLVLLKWTDPVGMLAIIFLWAIFWINFWIFLLSDYTTGNPDVRIV